MILEYVFAGLIGLIAGSFFGAIVARWRTSDSIVTGRSQCPHCQSQLEWHDLIPLFSFVRLKGRCRICHQLISLWYPILEIISAAVLVVFTVSLEGVLSGFALWQLGIILILLLLFFFDARRFVLPNVYVGLLAVLALGYWSTWGSAVLLSHLAGGFLLAGLFGILYVATAGRWLGFGDVKLAFALGMIFGVATGLTVVILSFWTATLLALILLVLRRATRTTQMPLGAFLCGMAIIALIFNEPIQSLVNRFF